MKILRKGITGDIKSDWFVISQTGLAPYVGASLTVMEQDIIRMRTAAKGLKPFVVTHLKINAGLAVLVAFIKAKGILQAT